MPLLRYFSKAFLLEAIMLSGKLSSLNHFNSAIFSDSHISILPVYFLTLKHPRNLGSPSSPKEWSNPINSMSFGSTLIPISSFVSRHTVLVIGSFFSTCPAAEKSHIPSAKPVFCLFCKRYSVLPFAFFLDSKTNTAAIVLKRFSVLLTFLLYHVYWLTLSPYIVLMPTQFAPTIFVSLIFRGGG